MKAYTLWVEGEDDAGQAIVFDKTAREAKKQVWGNDELAMVLERYTDLRVRRAKRYDGLEKDPNALALAQWRDGWIWFDRYDMPDPDTATDQEFLDWYADNS